MRILFAFLVTVGWFIDTSSAEPVAVDDSLSTNENTINLQFNVLDNDYYQPDGGAASFEVTDFDVLSANGATVNITAAGVLTYDPRNAAQLQSLAVGQSVADQFDYSIQSPSGAKDSGQVTVTVSGRNDAPVAENDSVSVPEDNVVIINVLENDFDVDNGDSFQITSLGSPSHGVATLWSGQIQYVPNPNYYGADSFTYQITDAIGAYNSGTVSIVVQAQHDAPIGHDDVISAGPDFEAKTLYALDNDYDVDGDELFITAFTQPQSGTVTLQSDGSLRYTPDTFGFIADAFNYTINDGTGKSSVATVVIASPKGLALQYDSTTKNGPWFGAEYRRIQSADDLNYIVEGSATLQADDWTPMSPNGSTIFEEEIQPDPTPGEPGVPTRVRIHHSLVVDRLFLRLAIDD